jgi:hypothetical protein
MIIFSIIYFVLSNANSLCAGCVPLEETQKILLVWFIIEVKCDSFNDSIRHQCAFEACHEDSVNCENLKLNDQINNNMEIKVCIFTVISRAHESKQFCFSF